MELPIAPRAVQVSPDELIRAAKRTSIILGRMAATESQLDSATALTNSDRPDVQTANFAADVHLPEDVEAPEVFEQISKHFDHAGTVCKMLLARESTWPETLVSQFESHGYQPQKVTVYLLTGYLRPTQIDKTLQIIPGRAAYKQLQQFFKHDATSGDSINDIKANDLACTQIDFLDEPRTESFLGRRNGNPVGSVCLVSLGQTGMIYNVTAAQDTFSSETMITLLAHTLDHCQRALFEQVIVECADQNPAADVFLQLGFRPAASYIKFLGTGN